MSESCENCKHKDTPAGQLPCQKCAFATGEQEGHMWESDTPPDRKHTPLPWKVLEGVSSNGMIAPDAATAIVADNEDGWDIAAVWTDLPGMNGAENPKYIALACNSHYKLVEALQAASDELQAMHGEYCQHQDYCPQETPKSEQCPTIAIIETARAALAAAAE